LEIQGAEIVSKEKATTGYGKAAIRIDPAGASRWMFAAIVIIGAVVTLIIAYGFQAGERIHDLEEPLVDAAREIKLEAAAAMLWLEKGIDQTSYRNETGIWKNINHSFWNLKASLADNDLSSGSPRTSEHARIQDLLTDAQEKLSALEKVTAEGLMESRDATGLVRSRQRYSDFLDSLDRLEAGLIETRTQTLQRLRYSQGLLLFISVGMTIGVGLIYQRFERQRMERLRDLHRAVVRMEEEMAVRRNIEGELRRARADSEKQVEARTAELRSANEKLRAEIAERLRIEELIRKSKSMLQTVFDGISDPLVLVDKDMKIKMMNRPAAGYYQIEQPGDFIGKVCRHVVGDDGRCDHCRIPQAVEAGKKITFERKGLMDPRRWEQVTVYPVSPDQHKGGDAVIRVTDITEARMIQNGIIRNEKMASLGLLVSSVAHEINNPNNFISFNIPILRDYLEELLPLIDAQAALGPEFKRFNMSYKELRKDLFKLLENIENGTRRISAFISNLREFAETREEKHCRWINLRSIIDKVIEMCRNKVKRSVKSFELDIPENLPTVFTEPFALEQILINLLINAVQSLDKHDTWVRLSVSISNGSDGRQEEVAISVSDNGCGLDENARGQLFDPFFTTKPPGEGTGLGLYVSRNLIEGLGGRILVDSEVGVGSKFTVILPLAPPEANLTEALAGQGTEG
jgi:signal transduction histidine kinase